MAPEVLILRILIFFLLRMLNNSSASPRGRSLMYPEPWQAARRSQQEGYGYRNRRPLEYIRALRQTNRKPSDENLGQVRSFKNPQENYFVVHSLAQIENQPDLSHQTLSQHPSQSEDAPNWGTENTPPLSASQSNHPFSKPRTFEFNLKVPFANSPGQINPIDSALNSDVKSGVSDFLQLYRPTSVQIHSSLNKPTASDSLSGKGSSKDPNGGKGTHEFIKPTFELSLSVPIPPPTPTPTPKPSISNDDYLPTNPQSHVSQGESGQVLSNTPESVQQQTQDLPPEPIYTKPTYSKLVTFLPVHASQHPSSSETVSQPSLQSQQYPSLPSDNIHYGYYSSQNPTNDVSQFSQSRKMPSLDPANVPLSPLHYENAPSGYYTADQVKAHFSNQPQTWQSSGTQFALPSAKYYYGQNKVFFGHGKNIKSEQHLTQVQSSSPAIYQSMYEIPLSGYHNREAPPSNIYKTDNVAPIQQTEYQYSKDQSGKNVRPYYPTSSDSTSEFQNLPFNYQTQMSIPNQSGNTGHLYEKPRYTKLYVHVDDDTDQDDVPAPTVHHYPGQIMAEKPLSRPTPYVPTHSQTSGLESGTVHYAFHPQKQMETDPRQALYFDPGQAYHANNVGDNAGFDQTNFGQHRHNQYSTDQSQPQYLYGTSTEGSYLVSDDEIQQFGLSHYTNPVQPVSTYQY